MPSLSWLDASHFIITINDISWIGVSLHEIDGIEVDYRLADKLSEENIAEAEKKWEASVLAEIQQHHVQQGQRDGALESFNFAKTVQKENLERFKVWARANVPGAYSQ